MDNSPAVRQPAARPRRSLASNLFRRLIPPVLALFALSGALAYFAANHEANEVQDHWLVDSVEALAQRVHLVQGKPELDLPEAARQIVQWDSHDTNWFQLWGERSGHLVGESLIPDRPASGVDRLRDAKVYYGKLAGQPVRVAAVAVRLNGAPELIEVRVAETLGKRKVLAAEMLLSVLLPQLLLAVIAAAIIWATLRQLIRPIGEVARALEAQTHYSLEPVDDRALPAEVAPLTQSVNDLLLRLQDTLAAQRHFIADAAHQLRTPLTALKLHADEAARETRPERLQPLIAELQQAADRAVRLSNQLLTLARAEPNARVRDALPFDLRAAAFEASSHWVPQALRAGMDLGFEDPAVAFGAKSPEALQVVGNAELLAEALHNLIDNAIVYGRPGGRITVSVRPAGGERVQIRVDDDGPGIPEGDRERVLQRFHRGRHTPRADGRSAHGAGLGLAIVSDIARAHGGEVRIADGETGRGTCVIIELPRWIGQGVEYLAEPNAVPASNEPRASGVRVGGRTPADAV